MNLVGRVLILSACVFTAYALPNLGSLGNIGLAEENAMLKAIVSSLEEALHKRASNSSNSTQEVCFNTYTKELNNINDQTVNQTQACYASADLAIAMYNENVNQSLALVNGQSSDLQNRLINCSKQNSSEAVFNCYLSTYDQNLGSLYNITSQSQLSVAAMSGYEWEVGYATRACVGEVLINNKNNSTVAASQLQGCLDDVVVIGGSNGTAAGNKTFRLN